MFYLKVQGDFRPINYSTQIISVLYIILREQTRARVLENRDDLTGVIFGGSSGGKFGRNWHTQLCYTLLALFVLLCIRQSLKNQFKLNALLFLSTHFTILLYFSACACERELQTYIIYLSNYWLGDNVEKKHAKLQANKV